VKAFELYNLAAAANDPTDPNFDLHPILLMFPLFFLSGGREESKQQIKQPKTE
jgi:hypothetical protein